MKHTFKSNSGVRTFGRFLEPLDASQYIYRKKARSTYCLTNNCPPKLNVGPESNLLLFNYSNKLAFYPCKNSINKANLYINLITKLDLPDVPVISDNNNISPTTITTTAIPYLDYNIDPNGILFGNTTCGLNNFINYMVYNINQKDK
jgi:hypothetical protein